MPRTEFLFSFLKNADSGAVKYAQELTHARLDNCTNREIQLFCYLHQKTL